MNKYQDTYYQRTISLKQLPKKKVIDLENAGNNSEDLSNQLYNAHILNQQSIHKKSLSNCSPLMKIRSMQLHKHSNLSVDYSQHVGKISDLSIKENEKNLNSFKVNDYYVKPERNSFNNINKYLLPSKNDFSKLLDTINSITAPRIASKLKLLQENESDTIIIEENYTKFFKIKVKSRQSPLIIKIIRKQGSLISYLSTITSEPGPEGYEKSFFSDYFEFRDRFVFFKANIVYLSIKAIKYSEFTIDISFGKAAKIIKELVLISKQSSWSELDQLDSLDKSYSPQKSKDCKFKYPKDFIKENKTKNILSSSMKASEMNLHAKNWEDKRKKIMEKKKTLQDIKKNKIIYTLNKKIIQFQQEEEERKKIEAKNKRKKNDSKWISLMYFYISCAIIKEKIMEIKKSRLKNIELNIKAGKIQSKFKRYTNLTIKRDVPILNAIRNLSFFLNHTKSTVHSIIIAPSIISIVKYQAHNGKAFQKFATFFKKIVFIQKSFRLYLKEKKKRMNHLIEMWELTCEHLLFRKSSTKKLRHTESKLLITIPLIDRDQLLSDYYHNCIKTYKEDIKKYLDNRNSIFQVKLLRNFIPKFQYIPSLKVMEKMIEDMKKNINNQ